MVTFRQSNFAKGEVTTSVQGREDLEAIKNGLGTARNMLLEKTGAIRNRPGTSMICETKFPGQTVGLIPFIFSQEDGDTYMLIFGNLYIWIVKNGALQYEASKNVTGATKGSQCTITTSAPHSYSDGDVVKFTGVGGMAQLNGRQFKVSDASGSTFKLKTMAGAYLSTATYDTYTSGGTVARVYNVTTTYTEDDLPNITYAQSADVVSLACRGFAPRELSRTGDIAWTLSTVVFNNIYTPRAIACTPTAGSNTYRYKVTALYGDTTLAEEGKESLPGTVATKIINTITKANPGVVTTSTNHGYVNGDPVYIDGADMTQVNKRVFIVANKTNTTFELQGVDTTNYTTYTTGGLVARTFLEVTSAAEPTTAAPLVLTWSATNTALTGGTVVATTAYNVYKESNGTYNFIGTTNQTTFNDVGVTSTSVDTPYEYRELFVESDDWPWTVTYYQGRLGYGGSNNHVDTAWLSSIGDYHNFSVHTPLRDSDAVTINLNSNQVNELRAMVGVRRLVILTAGAEWIVNGDSDGVLTPTAINAVSDDETGAAAIRPVVSGSKVLYCQSGTFVVRDLGFEFEADGYRGSDLTPLSSHLFDDHTVVSMAMQRGSTPTLWVVRDDGILLSLVYIRDQNYVGWTWHDTDGLFESVGVVPEGNTESVYFVVNRSDVRYVERLNSRIVEDIDDCVYVDLATSYNGWSEAGDPTMTLTGTYAAGANHTLTASASYFASTMVGESIFLRHTADPDDAEDEDALVKCQIVSIGGATTATVRPDIDVPSTLQAVAVAVGEWAHAIVTLPGNWQNEGERVSVLGDGVVLASPSNPQYDAITVASGQVPLPEPCAVVHAGRAYYSDLETLPIDTIQGETLLDKKILITSVTVFGEQCRGGFVGSEPPTNDADDPLEGLDELFVREDIDFANPPALQTGPVTVPIPSQWKSGGTIFIRQVDPLPLKVLALASGGMIPYRA